MAGARRDFDPARRDAGRTPASGLRGVARAGNFFASATARARRDAAVDPERLVAIGFLQDCGPVEADQVGRRPQRHYRCRQRASNTLGSCGARNERDLRRPLSPGLDFVQTVVMLSAQRRATAADRRCVAES
jgi:hypothetical protein